MKKVYRNNKLIFLLLILILLSSCRTQKLEENKLNQIETDSNKVEIENKSKKIISDDLIKNKKIKLDKTTEVSNFNKEKIVSEKKYKYIKSSNTIIYKDENQIEKIDTLQKGTRVEILESKEFEKDEKKKELSKIIFVKNLKTNQGWVNSRELTDKLNDILPKKWENLDFSTEYKKENYPENPKVEVKGIYLNIYTIGSEKKMEKLLKLAADTEINTFVIDVKDDNGALAFEMEIPDRFGIPKKKNYPIKNIEEFMKKMKENNIYTIARIVSFKDPTYAKYNPSKVIVNKETQKPFTNSDGIVWVSAHDRNLWDYNLTVAEEAAKVGFNEIQFDYVRFPASDNGKLDRVLDYRNEKNESKPETIQKYLKYAKERLTPLKTYVSADVYGQVGTFPDDMGLGQYWESISQVVDYISPMMYPSHYMKGAYGVAVPDAEPYKIIRYSLRDSINRNENISTPSDIRPWIQAFTATWVKGHIKYNEQAIREQIRAMNDLNVKEYLLWSPSNNYNITGK